MFAISSFYKFTPLDEARLQEIQNELQGRGMDLNLRGLLLISKEGFNGTIAGELKSVSAYKQIFVKDWGHEDLPFKDSMADRLPLKRFKVQIREEIVTLGKPEIIPTQIRNNHLSPAEFHEALKDETSIVLDTRNWYEVQMGKFQNAVDYKLNEFREFPQKLRENPLPKDQKILMYCTGGIRCEKAIEEMRSQGYENVYQLEGGILKYLEEFPHQKYEGECFVFDHRVAVKQDLSPSTTHALCPHCGQPGSKEISCKRCDTKVLICGACEKSEIRNTCSKNCAHHYRIRPWKKGPRQILDRA